MTPLYFLLFMYLSYWLQTCPLSFGFIWWYSYIFWSDRQTDLALQRFVMSTTSIPFCVNANLPLFCKHIHYYVVEVIRRHDFLSRAMGSIKKLLRQRTSWVLHLRPFYQIGCILLPFPHIASSDQSVNNSMASIVGCFCERQMSLWKAFKTQQRRTLTTNSLDHFTIIFQKVCITLDHQEFCFL